MLMWNVNNNNDNYNINDISLFLDSLYIVLVLKGRSFILLQLLLTLNNKVYQVLDLLRKQKYNKYFLQIKYC